MLIYQFFSDLPPETQISIGVIVLTWFWFFFRFNEQARVTGPTILTTMGIFATFVGIAMGLHKFDAAKIQETIPSLLSGLKTAFYGSVAGVGGALILKFRDLAQPLKPNQANHDDADATANDLAKLLSGIHSGLVGGEEGSLISQIKLSRQDANDRLDRLRESQEQALLKLSEMGSKQLVEALKDVIRDFNVKITEQFGDNFKELNSAVGQLLAWQHHFRDIVQSTTEKLEHVTGLMQLSADRYSEIVNHSGEFSKITGELSANISDFRKEKDQLYSVTSALTKLLSSAEGSLPAVGQKVADLTNQLANSVKDNQRVVNEAFKENSAQMKNAMQISSDGLKVSNENFNKQLRELATQTKDQVAILEKALEDELEKSLKSLGGQLAALSEKLVSDYLPLTEKLRRVVELAQRV